MDEFNQEDPSKSHATDEAFELLILKFLDGVHTEEDAIFLSDQLASSEAKRNLFAELSLQTGILNEVFVATGNVTPENESPSLPAPVVSSDVSSSTVTSGLEASSLSHPQPPTGIPSFIVNGTTFSIMLFSFLIGMIVTIALLGNRNDPNNKVVTNSETTKSISHVESVAQLTSTMGCGWEGNNSNSWIVGQSIPIGSEMMLREGIAEFKLESGVQLSVEGPAAIIMTSSNSLVLQQGKLTTRIPWSARDFHLTAGAYRLTGVDAEFGVQVKGNSTRIHVFSGEVSSASSPYFSEEKNLQADIEDFNELNADSKPSPIIVREGKAVELLSDAEGNTSVRHFAADQYQFASKISMAGQLAITSQYVDAVKKSKPIGYWRFEAVDESSIKNEITDGAGGALKVKGTLSLTGDAANHVLDLGESHDKENLVSSQTLNSLANKDYSVELWAKPSHYHRGYLVALFDLTSTPERTGLFIETQRDDKLSIDRPGTVRFGQRIPLGSRGTFCISTELYGVRRWQHIVAVNQKASMLLYVDGRQVGESKSKNAMIGGLNLAIGRHITNNEFPFVGQLDELSLYDRPLSAAEIKEHYNAVKEAGKLKEEI